MVIPILLDFLTNPDISIVKEIADICPVPERNKHVDGKNTYGKPRHWKYEMGTVEVPDIWHF